MKKVLCLLLVLVFVLSFAVACSKPAADEPKDNMSDDATVESGSKEVQIGGQMIEPLEEKVKVVFSTMPGSPHGLPLYIAQEEGWLDALNVEVEWITFDNGPAQIEAMAANGWDFGTTGFGGIRSGIVGYDMLMLADVLSVDDAMKIIARSDNDIVAAGQNLADYPEVYGDAESWKGAEIMLPVGSILHILLSQTLSEFGLTLDDVTVTNMPVGNANTAFKAGQGEMIAAFEPFSYQLAATDGNVVVSQGNKIGGVGALASMCVNPNTAEDAEKMEAILKCMDAYFAAVDWMKENFEGQVTYQLDMQDTHGLNVSEEDTRLIMQGAYWHTFDEAYERQQGAYKQALLNTLEFQLSLGIGDQETIDKMSMDEYYPMEYLEQLKGLRE